MIRLTGRGQVVEAERPRLPVQSYEEVMAQKLFNRGCDTVSISKIMRCLESDAARWLWISRERARL